MKQIAAILIVMISFVACSLLPGHKKDKTIVARYGDQYLYREDLAGIIQKGTSKNDSIETIHNYINNWVRTRLLVNQAENNLADELKDFDKEVQQYRNSLIIYKYESELVRQKLDTIVTPGEIQDYYNKNSANFLLRENIVKADYVIINKNSVLISRIRSLLNSDRENDRTMLADIVHKRASDFLIDHSSWIPFIELSRKIPINQPDEESFLHSNKFYETRDSINQYFLRIYDYKVKESISPISFESENIRKIILNKRKFDYLSRLEEDLFKEAVKKKKFEIY